MKRKNINLNNFQLTLSIVVALTIKTWKNYVIFPFLTEFESIWQIKTLESIVISPTISLKQAIFSIQS
jgi:hypothetical protein